VNPAKFEELRAKVREKYVRFGKMLMTPDGAELLKTLQLEFYDGDLLDSDSSKMAFNLGAREVVRLLTQMRDTAKGEVTDANQRTS
jgi:hypothetical protein